MSTPKATRADVAARRTHAIRMRTEGNTWDDIAQALGYADRAAAHKDVTRALEANLKEMHTSTEAHRELMLERLDAMYRNVWAVLAAKHVTVSNGRVVTVVNSDTGEKISLHDDGPVLSAVDRLLKIEERRSKLLGLDMPSQISTEAHVRYSIDGVDLSALT